ncbi:kinase-like domain-containing protein [Tribonema minus]|uniref:Kinase-like domain-containing protein n=1 Tax=Tribonema minus TaxID=303371 RepID=A0A836CLH3_9STRA|nr:kinase-like domain-containing protein [Tribonema minus]
MQARHLWKGHNLNVVNPKEIVLHKIIGEGSFGRVWSGMWRSSQVAVKEFVFAQAAVTGGSLQRNELIEEIVGEAAVMSFLRHPRILHLYGCSLTSQAIWIVSELCSRGSLRQVLDDRSQHLPLVMRLRIAVDIAEGMLYLHSREQPIIHRDLKSHNVFIQETATGELLPKIGDWGSARAVMLHTGGMRTMTHGVGTACWLAPEVIRHAKGSWQSDVYAFGILLWELATREEVHSNLSAAQIIARVANEGLRPKVPCNCPWREVMVSCWHEEPQARPSFTEVVRRLTALLERRVATQSSSISPLRPQRRGSGSGGAYSSLAQRSGTTSRSSGDRSSGSGTSEALPYRVRTHSLEEHDAGDATGRASGQESPVADLRELAQRAKSRRHRGKRPRYREDKEQS